jgi:hypothetical protein
LSSAAALSVSETGANTVVSMCVIILSMIF